MQIPVDEAFNSPENVYSALIGCYDAMQMQHYYGRNLIIVPDLASDNSVASGTKLEYASVDANDLLSDNILVEGIWADIYNAINRVNYMLFKLQDVTFLDSQAKLDYEGQLRFLRALHYFNLVRLYGGIPLKLEPTLDASKENFLPRSSYSDVYTQIIQDLEFARLNIKNIKPERATVIAAESLLASVFLTVRNYSEAINMANEAISRNPFLETKYANLFSKSIDPSAEIVFYIPFAANDKNRLAEYHFPNQLNGRYENSPSAKLISLIETNDDRKSFVASYYQNKYYTKKYSDLATGSDKVIVLRMAELFLIRAEANYMIDSVANLSAILDDVNAIRHRAKLDSVKVVGGDGLVNLINKEKQIEFAFEGKRWFDLIRTGKAVGAVPSVTQNFQMLFPIPQSEIIANPNIESKDQNPGY